MTLNCNGESHSFFVDPTSGPIFEYQEELWRCRIAQECFADDNSDVISISNATSSASVDYDCAIGDVQPNNVRSDFLMKHILRFGDRLWKCLSGRRCPEEAYLNNPMNNGVDLTDPEPADDGLSAGAIAMGVLAVAGIATGLCCCYKYYKSRCNQDNGNSQSGEKGEEVALRDMRPEGKQSGGDVTTPLSGDHPAAPSGRFSVVSRILGCCTGRTQEAVSVV